MKKEEEGPCRPQGTGQALCIESERRCRERAGRESREGRKKERRERRKMAKPMQSRLDLVSISQCIVSSSLHLLVLSSLFSLSLSLVLNLNVDLGVKFVDLGVTVVMLSNRSISRRSRG